MILAGIVLLAAWARRLGYLVPEARLGD
jgi:hypothetical protein